MTTPAVWTATFDAPLRTAFVHASAARRRSASVLVVLKDGDGRSGLGEGAPRPYVTGETLESVQAWLRANALDVVARVTDLPSLNRWASDNAAEIDRAPSAFCALETALLDLFARREGLSVETLLGLRAQVQPLQATAVYGASGPLSHALLTLRYRRAGMTDAKLKLTGDPRRDLHRARDLSRRGRLRLDANNLWPDADAATSALAPLSAHAWAVEEPVNARDWGALAEVSARTGMAVVLDESLGGPNDLTRLVSGPAYIANLRISRLGGVLRTIQTARAVAARGLPMVLGAHVGETSLLARIGLTVAAAVGPLEGYEGGYGPRLITKDPFSPSVGFDRDGRLSPAQIPAGPGWGLTLSAPYARLLSRLARL